MCCNVNWSAERVALSGSFEEWGPSIPCNHLVVYETDLGGRSVFLRTKESLGGCFPLESFVVEDGPSSSELSSVRSERSVNSRSAGVDMTSEREREEGFWSPSRRKEERDRGNGTRDASVAAAKLLFEPSFIFSHSPP